MDHIVENFFDSGSILITCFEHLSELRVFDTYHNCLHYNRRIYFQMVVGRCHRESIKKLLKYFLRFIIKQ